ncbi:MAG: PqqD family protein [Bacteroidales bacterium]
MNIFHRRKILRNTNALDLIPIRNHDHELNDDGKVVLVVPKFEKKWMRKFFIAPARKDHFNVNLDELGSNVWLMIDGNTTTKELANALVKRSPDIEGPQDRVLSFISMLYEQRYVTFKQLQVDEQNI